MSGSHPVLIRVVCGDVLKFSADVLVLKYAQNLHGADREVYSGLKTAGRKVPLPKKGDHTLIDTADVLAAQNVLFVGVDTLSKFDYLRIREFARQALAILADKNAPVRHLAITLHGATYGLDEQEAFESELAGLIDALSGNKYPATLERISIVERNRARATRLSAHLKTVLSAARPGWQFLIPEELSADTALRTAGQHSAGKRHVFVAMPFVESMDDTFHYGIESAVKAAGMLCERADLSIFVGDIMERVRQRIETASLVVADLTTANPNVYLEVGYAWGCRVPTVLLSKDTEDLKFDVSGHRCLIYKSIRQLEEKLTRELKALTVA